MTARLRTRVEKLQRVFGPMKPITIIIPDFQSDDPDATLEIACFPQAGQAKPESMWRRSKREQAADGKTRESRRLGAA